MGHPMDLNFQLFETAVLFITVLVVAILLQVCRLRPIILIFLFYLFSMLMMDFIFKLSENLLLLWDIEIYQRQGHSHILSIDFRREILITAKGCFSFCAM